MDARERTRLHAAASESKPGDVVSLEGAPLEGAVFEDGVFEGSISEPDTLEVKTDDLEADQVEVPKVTVPDPPGRTFDFVSRVHDPLSVELVRVTCNEGSPQIRKRQFDDGRFHSSMCPFLRERE